MLDFVTAYPQWLARHGFPGPLLTTRPTAVAGETALTVRLIGLRLLVFGPPQAPSAAALTPALATAFDTLINVAQYIALIGTVAMLVPGIRTAFRFLLTGVLAAALLGAVLILLLNEKIEHVKNRVETARPSQAVRGWWGRLF